MNDTERLEWIASHKCEIKSQPALPAFGVKVYADDGIEHGLWKTDLGDAVDAIAEVCP